MTEGIDGYSVPRPMRVLGPHERARFTAEAWGYLVGLSRSGLLDAVELEHVIERVLTHFDGRVALTDLRLVLGDAGSDGGDASIITH
ncbi:MAG TPA: DUF494 family protein [Gemmatimonadaceae bacterium]|jgi:uncharacterized protein Smg (DUF494 family)|nr:DUF494 family protein [Gemmatimonadaceae bacterium]